MRFHLSQQSKIFVNLGLNHNMFVFTTTINFYSRLHYLYELRQDFGALSGLIGRTANQIPRNISVSVVFSGANMLEFLVPGTTEIVSGKRKHESNRLKTWSDTLETNTPLVAVGSFARSKWTPQNISNETAIPAETYALMFHL